MRISAVVYTSQTGFTERYAQMLGKALSVPVYDAKKAKKDVKKESAVIYCGWLMGGLVRGLAPARKRFSLVAVCAVGMGETGSQLQNIRKMNRLPESLPVFSLQGGYREGALPAPYRIAMQAVKKSLIRSLSEKKNRSPGEENSLSMLKNGGDFVSEEALASVIAALSAESSL